MYNKYYFILFQDTILIQIFTKLFQAGQVIRLNSLVNLFPLERIAWRERKFPFTMSRQPCAVKSHRDDMVHVLIPYLEFLVVGQSR